MSADDEDHRAAGRAPRLFVEADLAANALIRLNEAQSGYLTQVLRLGAGDAVLVFNGREGEWRASIAQTGKRRYELCLIDRSRLQICGSDIHYLFAPLKRARLDYMVQKAVEMGVSELRPVMTRRTVAERVNLHRMRANAIEAAEQCGVLHVPAIREPTELGRVLDHWDASRPLIFCDEAARIADPLKALGRLRSKSLGSPTAVALLIGPEGGFSPEERQRLLSLPFVAAISLGPRIMRADTAAVAALALVNAVLGDWSERDEVKGL
ncbi:MAG TPA: 16S rRNA (uracil(1498)-N(3))-methyltransferase [Hyphomicrobiaceae bacterium]|nr:16S rRNA (uracil(1498)-N(3))-methyltransferase [Hyphomicrobiaceae bacterium]